MSKRKPCPMGDEEDVEVARGICTVAGCKNEKMLRSDVCIDHYMSISKFCEEGSRDTIK